MAVSRASAQWQGDFRAGSGSMRLGAQGVDLSFDFGSRFEGQRDGEAGVTSPEELLGAAQAGCFLMALSYLLSQDGHPPEQLHTSAQVTLEPTGSFPNITRVALDAQGLVPGITAAHFTELAAKAKAACPVSRLFDTEITLRATLLSEQPGTVDPAAEDRSEPGQLDP